MRQVCVSVCLLVLFTGNAGWANDPADAATKAAVKQVADQLLKAYQDEDAREFAALFTGEGEYVDIKGAVFHGRAAIEAEFQAFFREVPDSTMQVEFHAVRAIAPGVVVSECNTNFKRTADATPVPGRCQLVCTQVGNQWRIASLREMESAAESSPHHARVSQLEWLIGDWIAEGSHFQVHFNCHWDQSGQYLLRDFTVESGAAKPLSGTQRIGYDPLTRQLKIWVFDSAGGFSEGAIERDGDAWIVRTNGVTPDGQAASSTNSWKRLDDHRISSSVVDRSIDGERVTTTEALTLIRKPKRTLNRATPLDVSAKPEASGATPETSTNRQ